MERCGRRVPRKGARPRMAEHLASRGRIGSFDIGSDDLECSDNALRLVCEVEFTGAKVNRFKH